MRFNLMIHVKPYQLPGQRNVYKLEHISLGWVVLVRTVDASRWPQVLHGCRKPVSWDVGLTSFHGRNPSFLFWAYRITKRLILGLHYLCLRKCRRGTRQVIMTRISWATHVLQGKGQWEPRIKLELIPKPFLSSDYFLQLESIKEELPVIAYQQRCGEYVLKFCTNRPSRSERRFT